MSQLGSLIVSNGCRKTYKLHGGQVLLPPEVLLVLGSSSREHVVQVHDYVDGVVYEVAQSSMPTGYELYAYPGLQGGQRVVIPASYDVKLNLLLESGFKRFLLTDVEMSPDCPSCAGRRI